MNSQKLMNMQIETLKGRHDVPDDIKEFVQTIADHPIQTDEWIYRLVVFFLGLVILATVCGGIYLATLGGSVEVPDGIVAIGSAAVGALAGLLAPSPGDG